MRPAPAQVAATLSTATEPPSSALTSPDSLTLFQTGFCPKVSNEVSRRSRLVQNATTVAQNTASLGEKLNGGSMKTMIATSDRKWNQYFFDRLHADSTRSNSTSFMPNLRTSSSTITNSAR